MHTEMAIKLQFLGPEIVIMVLGPETDNMLQFMDPESVNKGERSYILQVVTPAAPLGRQPPDLLLPASEARQACTLGQHCTLTPTLLSTLCQ